MKLIPATHFVTLDEPCFSYKELNEQSPGFKGPHRYQIIRVVRGDKLAEFRRDLGPVHLYPAATEVVVVGGVRDPETGRLWIEETVGRCIEIGEQYRYGRATSYEVKVPDLLQGYAEQRKN